MPYKNRRNTRQMQREEAPSGINMLSLGWYKTPPFGDAVPVREEEGVEVTDWASVHVLFYGDPASDATAHARIRPWRYYETAPMGTGAGSREGRWVQDYERVVPIDPTAGNTVRSAHHVWNTRGAKKMFWQITEVHQDEESEENLAWLEVVPYGYVRADEPHVIPSYTESDGALQDLLDEFTTGGWSALADIVCQHNVAPATAFGVKQIGVARNTQAAAVSAEGRCVLKVLSMYGEDISRAHNYVGEYDRVGEVDPLDSKNYGDLLADVTGQGNGTYNYYFDMAGFKFFMVHWLSNTAGATGLNTLTFGVTAQDDGTAPAACTYLDVTNDWFSSASFTAINIFERDTDAAAKYVRVTITRTLDGGSNDGAWKIWLRRNY